MKTNQDTTQLMPNAEAVAVAVAWLVGEDGVVVVRGEGIEDQSGHDTANAKRGGGGSYLIGGGGWGDGGKRRGDDTANAICRGGGSGSGLVGGGG